MEVKVYNNPIEVAEKFAEFLSALIAEKEHTYIALSGGSTPKLLFSYLSTNYKKIDWKKVHLYWGDERCVPPDHKDSNYKMTFETLLQHIEIPSHNVHRVLGEKDPTTEAKRYAEEIESTVPMKNGLPQFDLVMLGMGDDGHTLSIFPHEQSLFNAAQTCVVATHPESGQKRVSITGKVANNALHIVFLVTGSSKAAKVEQIHKKKDAYLEYPAAHIEPSDGNLYWYMDKDATKLL
ncbi:MAG: 6-phosphogluconolactonase [Cytophagaceae bacterium]|jgi:6-phosphogluconolactonase|nr:6-phosphogluconolactonase [Cytophagaceae bacterium]